MSSVGEPTHPGLVQYFSGNASAKAIANTCSNTTFFQTDCHNICPRQLSRNSMFMTTVCEQNPGLTSSHRFPPFKPSYQRPPIIHGPPGKIEHNVLFMSFSCHFPVDRDGTAKDQRGRVVEGRETFSRTYFFFTLTTLRRTRELCPLSAGSKDRQNQIRGAGLCERGDFSLRLGRARREMNRTSKA